MKTKNSSRKCRNHILSMRVSADELGVIRGRAEQKGARVSEIMRDALKRYVGRSPDHTFGKEY